MDEKQIAALREVFEAAYVRHMNSQEIASTWGQRDYTAEEIAAMREGGFYNVGVEGVGQHHGYLNGCWWGFIACYQHLAPMVGDAERYRWLRSDDIVSKVRALYEHPAPEAAQALSDAEFRRGVRAAFDYIMFAACNTDDSVKDGILTDIAEDLLENVSSTDGNAWKAIGKAYQEGITEGQRRAATVAEPSDKLESPAQVGNTVFRAGVDKRLVIEAAQRNHQRIHNPTEEDKLIAAAAAQGSIKPVGREDFDALTDRLLKERHSFGAQIAAIGTPQAAQQQAKPPHCYAFMTCASPAICAKAGHCVNTFDESKRAEPVGDECAEIYLQDIEALMRACVQNIQKWSFPEYDSAHRAVKKLRALFAAQSGQRAGVGEGWKPIDTAPEIKGDYFFCDLAWGPDEDLSTGKGFRWNGRWFVAAIFYDCMARNGRQYFFREIEVTPKYWMERAVAPTPAAQGGV